MKNILFILIIIFSSLSAQKESVKDFGLKNGDLIFQEACSGNMNDAIKQVTSGTEGYNFTHVGMVL